MRVDQKIFYTTDVEGLPRKSGELVFHDNWEKRIFGMVVLLHQQGHFDWDEFKDLLIEQIRLTGETPEKPDLAKPGYYEFWIKNLEQILNRKKQTTRNDSTRG